MVFDTVKANLEKRGFEVSVFSTAAEAVDYLDRKIDGTTVGMGGSVTLRDIGLCERLRTHNEAYSHMCPPEGCMDPNELRRRENSAEIYISSVNGLAETGDIINIDGMGNRVGAICYGAKKVYLVAGKNKLAPDFETALERARNVASPLNAQRLSKKTPCAKDGSKCYDCMSPDRICNILQVLWRKPYGAEYEVILIDEDLGY